MSFRVKTLASAASVLLLPALLSASPSFASDQATPTKGAAATELIKAGAPALPFSLLDIDGKTVTNQTYAGKSAVLVAFWSFFCGPCREEIPLLDELLKKHAKEGLEMLAVNLDGPKMDKLVRNYLAKGNYSFRVLWEKIDGARYVTADAYGVSGTPTLVLLAKNGKVSWAHVGKADAAKIEAEIKKAIATAD